MASERWLKNCQESQYLVPPRMLNSVVKKVVTSSLG